MYDKLKQTASALTLSTLFATSAMGEVKIEEPVSSEDCKTLIAQGEASWYGDEMAIGYDSHGNPIFNDTASGEPFNPDLLTAAFRQKEYFGEYFKVMATDGDYVIVRVNDYGPFAEDEDGNDRVIDLSEAAARRIEMAGVGHVRVYACT